MKEKGIDFVKEELKLEHGDVIRDETPEEVALKSEVEALRKQLEVLKASGPDPDSIAEEVASATKELDEKEVTLYKLQAELDDKVKYAKHSERAAAERSAAAAAGGEHAPARTGSGDRDAPHRDGGAHRGGGGDRDRERSGPHGDRGDRNGPPRAAGGGDRPPPRGGDRDLPRAAGARGGAW